MENIKRDAVEVETKEWCGNHIEKGACGKGSGMVEGSRQDNMLEDGAWWCYVECFQCVCAASGCIRTEKEAFWLNLDETVEKIPKNERTVVEADLNGHVRVKNNGDEECIGRHGLGKRTNEGQAVVNFAKRMELVITGTYFLKKQHTESPTTVAYAVCRWITL